MSGSFTITPRGPFSLAEAAMFGFGQRSGAAWDEVMRLAFCLDGYQCPFRTWAAVLIRAATERLLAAEPGRFPPLAAAARG